MRCQILPLILLSGGLAFGMVACDSDEPGTGCNHDGVCDVEEDSANCSDDCPVCNHDFYCDVAGGENIANCLDDCSGHCDLVPMTGTGYDFIVQTVYYPDTVEAAKDNGIDIDGDGTIDNKLGEILQFLTQDSTDSDPSAATNEKIAEGELIMLWRIQESGRSDGFVHAHLMQGALNDVPPVFDGQDQVIIDPNAHHISILCGEWTAPRLETSPAHLMWTVGFPEIGTLQLTLSNAQVHTVSDPDNDLFGDSAITPDGWTNVMLGGGISRDEIDRNLIPFLVTFLNAFYPEGGDPDPIGDFFDGNCVAVDGLPGCEDVVAGEGECSYNDDPWIITETEVRCNADIYWMFLPDVDSDGDGEPDLLSIGYRVVSAVPVTIVEP